MTKITKKDLVARVATMTNSSKTDIEEVLSVFLEEISKELENGNEVDLFGFGKYEVKNRAGRIGVNPRTKEPVEIAPSKVIGFKPSKPLKNRINK